MIRIGSGASMLGRKTLDETRRGRTIFDWAIPLDLTKTNPFEKVKDFDIPDRGHVPWPSWVVDYVRAHAPIDLVRMERLGIMTCQRVSDLIRMGPEHRERNGIWCRPKKTRKLRRAFHVPLSTADAIEIDVHEQPLAKADRSFPRGSVSLFAEGREVHRRRPPCTIWPMACRNH
jgi:integrase